MDLSPAFLSLLRLFVVREYKAGGCASGGDYESALHADLPHRRCGFEYVRICPGVWLQGRAEDGPGKCLPGVVVVRFFILLSAIAQNGSAHELAHSLLLNFSPSASG